MYSFIEKGVIMTQSAGIKLFEDKNIRTLWNDVAEKWCFSVVDIVGD
ncbi:MAG: hypothetical protein LBF28_02975 [Rickettsiales bacterium]|jgi:hypothetical protein|nr:hypothetical protein [Rickettsiales bacterium]